MQKPINPQLHISIKIVSCNAPTFMIHCIKLFLKIDLQDSSYLLCMLHPWTKGNLPNMIVLSWNIGVIALCFAKWLVISSSAFYQQWLLTKLVSCFLLCLILLKQNHICSFTIHWYTPEARWSLNNFNQVFCYCCSHFSTKVLGTSSWGLGDLSAFGSISLTLMIGIVTFVHPISYKLSYYLWPLPP